MLPRSATISRFIQPLRIVLIAITSNPTDVRIQEADAPFLPLHRQIARGCTSATDPDPAFTAIGRTIDIRRKATSTIATVGQEYPAILLVDEGHLDWLVKTA